MKVNDVIDMVTENVTLAPEDIGTFIDFKVSFRTFHSAPHCVQPLHCICTPLSS
jgi:hypothetical protein